MRLARLVTNLLTLASADAPAPPSEPVDLAAAARERRDALARAGRERGPPRRRRRRGAAVGLGSADDVATSLDNLIENALVHTPEGSTVTITWGREGDEAFVAVLDEGPGISARGRRGGVSALPARRRAARRARRNRLGLAIVGALAARWGGSASLGARPEGGTRAEIRLPAALDAMVSHLTRAVPWPLDALSSGSSSSWPSRACSSPSPSGLPANSIASRSFTPGADALPSAGSLAPRGACLRRPPRATTANPATKTKPSKPKPASQPEARHDPATTADDHGGERQGLVRFVRQGRADRATRASHGGKGSDD